MMKKRINIETKGGKVFKFETAKVGNRFRINSVDFSGFFTKSKTLGETGNLEDAISLAKSHVTGVISNIAIKDI